MKTYKNLIHNNITLDKCKSIIVRAAKHKHKRNSVKKVLDNIDFYALKLYEMVLRDKYDFKPTHTFKINEYGKERTITSAPFFPNQCIDYLMLECGFRDIILRKKILNLIYTTKNLICYKGWVFSSNCYKIKLRLYYNKGA